MNRIVTLLAVVALSGCAGHRTRIIDRPAPSVQPVRSSVKSAQENVKTAKEASGSSVTAIRKAIAIAKPLEAKAGPENKAQLVALGAALEEAQKAGELSALKAQEALDALAQSLLQADALEKEVRAQNTAVNEARQTVADQQDQISRMQKEHASLVRRVNYYRIPVAGVAGYIGWRLVPMLLLKVKLAVAAGAFLVTYAILYFVA